MSKRRSITGSLTAMPLYEYQTRWVQDPSRFKIAVKSARIGFSFGTGLEAVLDCLNTENTTWTVLSASKAQSVEFIENCSHHIQLLGEVAETFENEDFWDEFGKIEAIQTRITFPNGARIIALAANARTARGYPGNVILDEFAHHEDSYAIWAAATRQVALGHKVRVLSTPNGEQGKFYDLCKELGLTDGVAPEYNFKKHGGWSVHWINAEMAIADGCPIDMQEMRDLIKDDDIVNQEFYCVFLKSTGAWLPLELIQSAEDAGASMSWPTDYKTRNPLYGGIDVGRVGDNTSFWLKEKIGDVLWTRMVLKMHNTPFEKQCATLDPWVQMTTRTAIDSTGMGIALFDLLNVNNSGRVMGVNFAGSSRLRDEKRQKARATSHIEDGAVKLKTDLAIKIKRSFEGSRERIPYDLQIRTELAVIKREAAATGVTFDAPRITLETAVAGGVKRKSFAHADHFWACALATYASQSNRIEIGMTRSVQPTIANQLRGF